jgi:hypothetical protein
MITQFSADVEIVPSGRKRVFGVGTESNGAQQRRSERCAAGPRAPSAYSLYRVGLRNAARDA